MIIIYRLSPGSSMEFSLSSLILSFLLVTPIPPKHGYNLLDLNQKTLLEWLEETLKASTAKWLFVLGHYPGEELVL